SLASFANYDEYGQGVLESAQIHWQKSLDRAGLQELLTTVTAARR
ncbi:MAG: hypothetical protein HYV26_23890, partial [Candidatus Hydrogenedentes bacterium]|nr:hypothetical protein [Candidatus Hydrogenedentota bacterium]